MKQMEVRMVILRNQVFHAALERYPDQKVNISALFSFLRRIETKTDRDLKHLLPEAFCDENGLTHIRFGGSFAGHNLIFKGNFNHNGNFVIADDIVPSKG